MKFIPNSLSTRFGRQLLLAQKNSPRLLFVGGILGVTTSTVLACKATLKLEEVIHCAQNDLDIAKGLEHSDYSDKDRSKDIALIYVQSAVKVGQLYGPALVVGAASVAALTTSHRILSQRNVALTAAYAAVDRAFANYRERVIDKYGEEVDRTLRYEAEEVETVNSRGKITREQRAAPGAASMYAKFFDEYSTEWCKEPDYNLNFLRCQQNFANDMLKSRGHLFLNEVYYMLGLPHTTAGSVVGWVIGTEGDNMIDFGIYDKNDSARAFVNGREGSILLDFNVDGVIYDKIENIREEARAWQS